MPARPMLPPSFDSERLTIGCYAADDGPAVNAAVLDALATLRPWMPWAQIPPSLDESAAFCRRSRDDYLAATNFTLKLALRDTGEMVGSSGLHPRLEVPDAYEIGYWLRPGFVGQGLVTEAVRAIAAIGFEALHASRIEIHAEEHNARSRAVPERLGWRHIGQRDHLNVAGEKVKMIIYAVWPPG
ncbi:MAG: GNAT family N-acetyltransferase [Armatimonadetes bacterium]|nr:GNAT family N-acetyltransferase [Armatimonadota bacterium]